MNAYTKEKVYCICGLEFGPELEGRIAIIKKGLYGLKSSGAQWHVHFATTLYSLGFIPTRFDPNVWIKRRDDGKGYDYISTYVDNFLIPAKEPKNTWINYKIYILSRTLPSQRTTWEQRILGAQGVNVYNRKTLIKEAISRIEKRMKLTLREEKMHMRTSDHPEIDMTPLLDTIMHREYQSLFGMLQWAVTLCRVDICFATSTMSRFSAASREGHLTRVLRIWGYLKKYPNHALGIDHTPLHNKDETVIINQ